MRFPVPIAFLAACLCPCLAQVRAPDIQAQRAAMEKLKFLVGEWVGEVRVSQERGRSSELLQTEEAQYKSDGLVLVVEGAGSDKYSGEVISRSLGVISYDDDKKSYRFRSWNDGRYVETELKLAETGRGLTWEYRVTEDIRIRHFMRMDPRGEWIQSGEVIHTGASPRKFLDVLLKPRK